MPPFVTCRKCGWISYAVSKKEAEEDIASFNALYYSLDDEGKARFNGPASLDGYRCRCGASDFTQGGEDRLPDGATVCGVIFDFSNSPQADAQTG